MKLHTQVHELLHRSTFLIPSRRLATNSQTSLQITILITIDKRHHIAYTSSSSSSSFWWAEEFTVEHVSKSAIVCTTAIIPIAITTTAVMEWIKPIKEGLFCSNTDKDLTQDWSCKQHSNIIIYLCPQYIIHSVCYMKRHSTYKHECTHLHLTYYQGQR